jgi:serine/threonine protein kinase
MSEKESKGLGRILKLKRKQSSCKETQVSNDSLLNIASPRKSNEGTQTNAFSRSRSLGFGEDSDLLGGNIRTNLLARFCASKFNISSSKKSKSTRKKKRGESMTGDDIILWLTKTGKLPKTKAFELACEWLKLGILFAVNYHKPEQFAANATYTVIIPNLSSTFIEGELYTPSNFRYVEGRTGKNYFLIKALPKTDLDIKRVSAEVKKLVKLSHPAFPELRSFEQTTHSIVFTTDLPRGGNLFTRLAQESFSERVLLKLIIRIAETLNSLHEKGYIYGNLSLNSIYLSEPGNIHERSKIQLIDIEHAIKPTTEKLATLKLSVYSAPELLFGGHPITTVVDTWSLGVCFYWLLFGFPPFVCSKTTNLSKFLSGWSPNFPSDRDILPDSKIMLMRLLHNNPTKRLTALDVINWPLENFDLVSIPVRYPMGIWSSLVYLNVDYTNESDNRRVFAKKATSLNILSQTIEFLVASADPQFSKTVVSQLNTNLLLDNPDRCTLIYPEVSVRLYPCHAFDLHWQPQFDFIIDSILLVNLAELNPAQWNGTKESLNFMKDVSAADNLYRCTYFYDRI